MALILTNAGHKGVAFDNDEEEPKNKAHCGNCPFEGDYTLLTGYDRFKAELHFTMESPSFSTTAKVISVIVMFLIFVSTTAFCLETLPTLQDDDPGSIWSIMEMIVVLIFSLEYLLRIFASSNRLNFIIQFLNMIDLLAVLPWYIELVSNSNSTSTFRVFRVVRLARVFRLFKMSRYSTYMQIMGQALKKSTDAFGLLLFFIGIAVVIFSSLMYYAERGSYDEALGVFIRADGEPTPFPSIPSSFYWCIVTMTTVGYGDAVPITGAGKVIACTAMICGILVIALPITILGQNFQDVYTAHKKPASKIAVEEVTTSDVQLLQHIASLKKQRVELTKTMRHLKFVLSKRCSGNESDFMQMWTSVDFVMINGLRRIEQFLINVDAAEAEIASNLARVASIEVDSDDDMEKPSSKEVSTRNVQNAVKEEEEVVSELVAKDEEEDLSALSIHTAPEE